MESTVMFASRETQLPTITFLPRVFRKGWGQGQRNVGGAEYGKELELSEST